MRTSIVFSAPYEATIETSPIPVPEPTQLLVQTVVSAISPGTEMLFYRGQVPTGLAMDATIDALSGAVAYPLKYGYATVGRVIDVGAQENDQWLDKLVFAFHPHASHFVTEPEALLPIPDGVTPAQAALLPNMETAVNFVMDGQPTIGEQVAVFGQGIVGLLTTSLLARFPLDALIAVEPHAIRRTLALDMGASGAKDPQAGLADLHDLDLAYELSGAPIALDQAVAATGYAGRIVIGSWYGQKRTNLNLGGHFHRSRMHLISSQVSTIAPHWAGRWDKSRRFDVAWKMLRSVDTEKLVTHRVPVEDAAEAYLLVEQRAEEVVQLLFTYE